MCKRLCRNDLWTIDRGRLVGQSPAGQPTGCSRRHPKSKQCSLEAKHVRVGGALMNSVICDAIRIRTVVQFTYSGSSRTAEPHCHGFSKAGHEVLRAYQTGGTSRSGVSVGWKLFEVRKMSGIRSTGQRFSTNRAGYDRNDEHMVSVHCCV